MPPITKRKRKALPLVSVADAKSILKQMSDKYGPVSAQHKASGVAASMIVKLKRTHKMTERIAERLKAALNGSYVEGPSRKAPSIGGLTDCIVMASEQTFTMLYDVVTPMGGNWLFKKKAGGKWVAVLRMGTGRMRSFLALARAEGAECFWAQEEAA